MVDKLENEIRSGLHFDHTTRAWVLINGVEDTPLQQFLLSSLCSFDSIVLFWLYYLGIVWTDKLRNCVQGICFMIYLGNRKKDFSHISLVRLQEETNASSTTTIL